MRGRKPVPSVLANLHGNPGGRKTPSREPKPIGNLAAPPDWFSDAQKAGWDYVVTNAPPGMLKRLDRGALAAWCVAEDLHRQASAAQNKVGSLVMRLRPNENIFVQSPYLPVINRQALIMLKAASELGFTPTSRPRIFAGDPAPGVGLHGNSTDDLDSFLETDPDRRLLN